ncbi:MAG TPA: phytoene/squalene synthase family protein [Gemmataceae bacterium]|nr:phytoene/squalene synthase family protein [Gemmataceae bacterium]
MITGRLSHSYRYCERLARREAANFFTAFRVLPRPQRLSTCALYAFLRIADDLSDEPGEPADKRALLADWRERLGRALAGDYSHPIHAALHDTFATCHIPRRYLDDALDGVEMDLGRVCFSTFADLRLYCYRVASVVGLACVHIWGFCDERALIYAENAGIAFQLTNILRDLGEDAQRGRVYLPRDELDRFGYDPERFQRGERDERFRALMRFQIERARGYYEAAWPLLPLLRPAGRAVFLVMARTYRSLLDVMERRDYDVFSSRVRVSGWRKLLLALGALPVRWGWA